MGTLHDRLEDLAQDAPTGGPPPTEIWARGTRAHRLRVAGLAATLVVVGAVSTGIGVRLAGDDAHRSDIAPAGTVGFPLPIEYPAGTQLPDLGDTPGPLAAIWLTPALGGGASEAVGLVAETGRFGTLPIDDVSGVYSDPDVDAYFALSPDGRRIAYHTPADELVVRDLVSGESSSLAFQSFRPRRPDDAGYTWVDPTHLVGHVDPEADPASAHQGGEADGWVWEPGTTPRLVDLNTYPGSIYLWGNAGNDPWFLTAFNRRDRQECPFLRRLEAGGTSPVLCDVVGVIGSGVALTHDGDGAVVALDVRGIEDPALRRVVATAGGPPRVTFATDLIGTTLDVDAGAS